MYEKTAKQYPIGMVYGVFDGFHEGHRHLLHEAQKRCDSLVVVVAHPTIVSALKQHLPHYSLEERLSKIKENFSQATVVTGDTEIGTWSALKQYRPDIVFLGYDQIRLGQELEKIRIPHAFITAHHPEKFKSSLLNKKDSATA